MKKNKEVGSYMVENKLRNELKAFLEREYSKWQYNEKNGCYFDEAYVDYNDELTDKGSEERLREPQRKKAKQRIMDVRSVVALVAATVPLLVTMILLIIAVIKF